MFFIIIIFTLFKLLKSLIYLISTHEGKGLHDALKKQIIQFVLTFSQMFTLVFTPFHSQEQD